MDSKEDNSITVEEAMTVLKRTQTKITKKPSQVKKNKGVMLFVDKDMRGAVNVNKFDEVYPDLYLGDQWLAREKKELARLGITHIVNTAQGEKYFMVHTNQAYYADTDIKFLGIEALDVSRYNMEQHFRETAHFIDDALNNNGRVYVHCFHGISRSSSVIIAFLMLKCQLSLTAAILQVRQNRPIKPNSGFMGQLVELNNRLYGKKGSGGKERRTRDNDGAEDERERSRGRSASGAKGHRSGIKEGARNAKEKARGCSDISEDADNGCVFEKQSTSVSSEHNETLESVQNCDVRSKETGHKDENEPEIKDLKIEHLAGDESGVCSIENETAEMLIHDDTEST